MYRYINQKNSQMKSIAKSVNINGREHFPVYGKFVNMCMHILTKVCCYLLLLLFSSAHDGPVNSIAFHSSGNYLLSASSDNTIRVCKYI